MPKLPPPPRAVRHTVDFDRIVALPRREPTLAEAKEWAREFTEMFLRPGAQGELRPWQGYALAELAQNAADGYGLWAVLPVGLGKTLLTFLMSRLVGAKRPVLIVPASLHDKTLSDFAALFRTWDNRNAYPEIFTVEALSRVSGESMLARKKPDLIAIDECDVLANPKASATRRIDRFVVDHEPIVFAATGTPSRNSILNYWHLVAWCLRDRMPLPLDYTEAQDWADAIDNKKVSVGKRTEPGVLGLSIPAARKWYRERLTQTPGVLVVDEDSAANVPLTVRVRLAPEDPELDAHFSHFLQRGEILGGIPKELMTVRREGPPDVLAFKDGFSKFRVDGQLGLGFIQFIHPKLPKEYIEARKAAAGFVRAMIEQSTGWSRPLDTEAHVFARYPDHEAVLKWKEWKGRVKPKLHTRWISDSALDACEAWLRESRKPGIIWVGSREFAARLAERTRLPYYANHGRTEDGMSLHSARPPGHLIVSWNANKRGQNLQAWPRQLITLPPPSAKWIEQIIGRSHRAGAKEHVHIEWLATSGGSLDGFEAMISEARFEKETVSVTKKALRATIVRATPTITEGNRFRWARA